MRKSTETNYIELLRESRSKWILLFKSVRDIKEKESKVYYTCGVRHYEGNLDPLTCLYFSENEKYL